MQNKLTLKINPENYFRSGALRKNTKLQLCFSKILPTTLSKQTIRAAFSDESDAEGFFTGNSWQNLKRKLPSSKIVRSDSFLKYNSTKNGKIEL